MKGLIKEFLHYKPEGFSLENGTCPYYLDVFKLCCMEDYRDLLLACINKKLDIEFDSVAGISMGGIVLATLIAKEYEKDLGVIRNKKKGYGLDKTVEGVLSGKVLLVDDVIYSGNSIKNAIKPHFSPYCRNFYYISV